MPYRRHSHPRCMGTFRLFGCFWSELGCFDPGRGVYCEDVGVGRLWTLTNTMAGLR